MSLVLDAIGRHATECGGATALSDSNVQISYGALSGQIEATADLLLKRCPDDRPLALIADNSAAWVLVDLAAISIGRPLVPLPHFMSNEQRRYALAQTGAGWLIADLSADDEPRIDVAGKALSLARLPAGEFALHSGTGKVTFTSGTTGQPKGVCLSQAGMEVVATSLVDAIGRRNAGVHVAVLPLAVLLENVAGLYSTLLAGGHYRVLAQSELGFSRPFEPDFAMLIDRLGSNSATTAILVPEILRGILAVLRHDDRNLPDLRFLAVGGAKVPDGLLADARSAGLPVYEGYGLSEAASVVALNVAGADRSGSVGRPLAHVGLDIAASGEIILSDPAFLGYVGEEPAPGIFPTGDIGRVDEDGYVFIQGRLSNVLITGFGRNVAPEWVESELAAQPEIRQALVFGEGAPGLAALIVPASSTTTDGQLAAAVAAANQKLPDYARVRQWLQVQPFSFQNRRLTANGRLRRDVIYGAHEDQMNVMLQAMHQQTTFLDRLASETAKQRDYLLASEQLRRGLAGAISVETYRQYLAEAYHHVRHTVLLMKLAKTRLPAGREWLAGPLDDYIAEETGHEEWILDDIRNTGGDPDAVRHGRPRIATEVMVAYAYDYINRINPVGFFGMVYVLESTSTQFATAGAGTLMKSLGLPAECFRYLTSHGSLDLEHMKFFETIMSRIDHAEDRDAIVHVAQRMYVLFGNVFRAIPLDGQAGHDIC